MQNPLPSTVEDQRLAAAVARMPGSNWQRWGPYLSERQWGTVREDYSANGNAWKYLPHDHARSRAYRWGEDGLLGICDRECRLCFALALWNGKDPILKERLFGLDGKEGNHGEDVKELYYYLDSTPTHSYLKGLYKYPQAEFPYHDLTEQNSRRDRSQLEYEIEDTGVFADMAYWDVTAEYAKGSPNDILVRLTFANRGTEPATLHALPTLWFRNTWDWGCETEGCWPKPSIRLDADENRLVTYHVSLEPMLFHAGPGPDGKEPKWLFTENETNNEVLFGTPNGTPCKKDGFHRYVVDGETERVKAKQHGTKAAAHYQFTVPGGEEVVLHLRLSSEREGPADALKDPEPFSRIFSERIAEADEFYAVRHPETLSEEERRVCRQSDAGLLWTKQFYHYVVEDWIKGDPAQPPVAPERKYVRNAQWGHMFTRDVLSMPDKWEYPWFAAWDTAFHMIPFAKLDPYFSRDQLILFLREWYLHPNGQIPAYEWEFSDVNPPVHAWSVWRVYQLSGPPGKRDRAFLERAFHKLLLNFTWWVNRKDPQGRNLFGGGFLGLDNIGVFDRSKELPAGGHLEQADGTAWMAFFCAQMLNIAFELAGEDRTYADVASKFFEHYISIANAMNTLGGTGLWDEEDGFYYDRLVVHGRTIPMRLRSMVGIIPLFTVDTLESETLDKLPSFKKRMEWFLKYRGKLLDGISYMEQDPERGEHGDLRLLALPSRRKLERILKYVLDEDEFLSPHGVRSLSKYHEGHPFTVELDGRLQTVSYIPGESDTYMFGGNSNWRGPIWFPVNFLLIEALQKYDQFYGESFTVECPTGSGNMMTLGQVARELERRLISLFLPGEDGRRPCHGENDRYATDPHWKDLVLFYEYFHGDTGRGCGASHQTGWTALAGYMLANQGRDRQGADTRELQPAGRG